MLLVGRFGEDDEQRTVGVEAEVDAGTAVSHSIAHGLDGGVLCVPEHGLLAGHVE